MRSPTATAIAPRLGAHMSIAGGLPRAVERARQVDATALQIFVKSNRQWRARELDEQEVDAFHEAVAAAGLGQALLAHASYLINLASGERALRERSIAALGIELDRCARLGVPQLVLHPGTFDQRGPAVALRRVAGALQRVYRPRSPRRQRQRRRVRVLLETTAGQGSALGRSFEELACIIDRSGEDEMLGVCFDTCHALAAGYEFRDAVSYEATFAALHRQLGLSRVRAFHLNDSQHELGSRRDRHQHIGQGHVGLEAFRLLLNDPRFRDRPMVLETPKGAQLAEDRVNLGVLRAMIGTR